LIRHGGEPPGEPPQRSQPPRDAVRVALLRLLPWSGLGEPVPHARQARRTSLFSHPALAPVVPKKPAPSLL
jgi:hypothetical protein